MKTLKMIICFASLFCLYACVYTIGESPNDSVWQMPQIETVTQETNTSDVDSGVQAILDEINYVRTKPSVYAEQVVSKRLNSPAARELYNELLATEPLHELTFASGLNSAADWFVSYQGESGEVGHYSRIGGYEAPEDRINQFGQAYYGDGENVSYGLRTARDIVLTLLIDEGVPSRGHRRNILSKGYTKIGIATGYHMTYGTMCVMDFAGDYR